MSTTTLSELRHFTTDDVRRHGYAVAYCRLCGCNKSGEVSEPNAVAPGCRATWCLCHTEDAFDILRHAEDSE